MIVTLGIWDGELGRDLDRLSDIYVSMGVKVIRLPSLTSDSVFHRDVMAWTPFGIIMARMGKSTRAWEPEVWFNAVGITPVLIIEGSGTFEGADLVFVSKRKAVIGVGQRTSRLGARQVDRWLSKQKVTVTVSYLPSWHDQHLLGVANVLSEKLLRVGQSLPKVDYDVKGPNWVQVGSSIIVPGKATKTIDFLRDLGQAVVPVQTDGLLAHGGGPACATGVIEP